ncbi:hypothetical protein Tco_0813666 [Tanacetum coccineum]
MMKAVAGWYEPPAFATRHLVAATVAASHCRTLTKEATTVGSHFARCRVAINEAQPCWGSGPSLPVALVGTSTYGGPSLSNDGEKRKDGGRRSNLVATSPKADTHLALALNENPYSNRVV